MCEIKLPMKGKISSWGGGENLPHPPLLQGKIYPRKHSETQLKLKGLTLSKIEPCPMFLSLNNDGVKMCD